MPPIFAPGGQGFAAGSKLDSRFNIQVYQLLPFVGWDGTSWEVMVAVRNLFYENFESASFLDEFENSICLAGQPVCDYR